MKAFNRTCPVYLSFASLTVLLWLCTTFLRLCCTPLRFSDRSAASSFLFVCRLLIRLTPPAYTHVCVHLIFHPLILLQHSSGWLDRLGGKPAPCGEQIVPTQIVRSFQKPLRLWGMTDWLPLISSHGHVAIITCPTRQHYQKDFQMG